MTTCVPGLFDFVVVVVVFLFFVFVFVVSCLVFI